LRNKDAREYRVLRKKQVLGWTSTVLLHFSTVELEYFPEEGIQWALPGYPSL
jgi:hypothetical protein